MRPKIFFPIMFLTTVAAFATCDKKKDEIPKGNSTPLSYTSLVAEQTTIHITQNTKITATASGEGLIYTWTLAGTGNLIGSGYQIIYKPCCAGQQTITCVIKDSKGNQEGKSVTITVQK